ncbi:hypothetical protein CMK20_05760 [Candidatus Poribacteria bacterium]|nr:hypothetical protein [Candidatus Poribacteria bacterium]|tara:strand:+ start:982 stop:1632 length:651 start_codon:yes stop_codon:yes gene_type:complete
MSRFEDDQYKTIAKPVTTKLTVKKSRFIGVMRSVDSMESVKFALSATQRAYPSASHYCYGYQFGLGKKLRSYATDDGEPTNSAGKPILSILKASGLSNLICLITRYYGGVNLGVGGLIRAYSQCTKQCLDLAETITQTCYQQLVITVVYDKIDHIYRLSRKMKAIISDVVYGQNVVIQIKVRPSVKPQFTDQLMGISGVISVDIPSKNKISFREYA